MNEEIKTYSRKTELITAFNKNYTQIAAQTPDFINKTRLKSIAEFEKVGFPSKKSEQYKYTNIESAFFGGYKRQYSPQPLSLDIREVFTCDVPELDNYLLLVNGWFYNTENKLMELQGGVLAGSVIEASKKFPELVEKYYGKHIENIKDPLSMLNMAFAQDGLFVYIPKGVVLEKPVQLINLIVATDELMIQPYNLIITEEGSSGSIVICDHSLNPQAFLLNSTTEVIASKNSKPEIYRQQNAHDHSVQISNTFITQKEGSNVNSVYVTLYGGTVRNNLFVNLSEPYSHSRSYGLWLADKTQHIDNNTFIHHTAPNCESFQLYKGILDDSSTGIFSGRILVDKSAQKTDAYQSNKNLLLTNEAKVRSKPQLEIYADDVKCSHGSATGQLDEDAMFYLCSRGIPKKESCQLLMQAFTTDVTDNISIAPLRDEINGLVEKRLRGELSRCNKCKVNCGK
ncbi:MAG: Fe-S cluster assembly protein SufD [Bacteroidetes bacterium CG23_combo_of_CG06-09_8_20_14_all_32_9]|nr:MAG: Fe-S cluster assembly protein SufD [Bacteroidetes bacterium CG23_combo_of_CG06-09_8_20_14_all_32_9]